MNYLFMAIAIIFAAANSLILRQFKNRTFKTAGDVFFFNGALVIISTVAGGIAFKEKLNKLQLTGIIMGLIALVVNSI